MHQETIDFGVDDMPLFSGTPQVVTVEGVSGDGTGAGRQLSFFACSFCKDGGRIDGRYCFCEAGTAARLADREKEAGHDR